MSATQASGGSQYQLGTTLTAPQTWTTTNAAGALVVLTGVALNGHALTFDGAGTTVMFGAISNTAGSPAGAGRSLAYLLPNACYRRMQPLCWRQ